MNLAPMVPLEELMAARQGSVNPLNFADETFELYSIPAFDSRKPEVLKGRDIGSTKQVVQSQDVLLSKIVPHIRRSWIVGPASNLRQIASGEWIVFRSARVVPEYLRHALQCDDFHAQFMQTVSGVGGSLLRARPAQVAKIRIPLPTVSEQRRIAAILDQADALRAKRREALAQLDRLAQSVFVEMFGDPVSNPMNWPMESLTDVCHCYSGGTPSKSNPEYWQGDLPWFSAKDLKADDLFDSQDHISETVPKTTSLKLLPADTVAIVVRGMILAHTFPVSVLRVPATINQDLKALLPRKPIETQFLACCLRAQRDFILEKVSEAGHGTKRLDTLGLQEIRVPQVPDSLQKVFVARNKAIENLKTQHRTALAELDALFASLQHRAFRGDL